MTELKEFSIEQLGIFIGAVFGSLAICIKAIQKSRCSTIKFGCITIHRDVRGIEQPVDLSTMSLENQL